MANKTDERKLPKTPLLWLAALMILAALAAVLLPRYFCLWNGRPVLLTGDALDLRQETLTMAQYEALAAKLPEREILWRVPIGDGIDSTAREITLDSLSEFDIPLFACLQSLETVNAEACPDHAALSRLQNTYPQLDIRWSIHLGGQSWSLEAEQILLEGLEVSHRELMETLGYFAPGTQVLLDSQALTPQELCSLRAAFPELTVWWRVELMGQKWDTLATELTFGAEQVDTDALMAAAEQLASVSAIHMGGGLYTIEELNALREAYGGAAVRGRFELYGITVEPGTQFLDLSGIPMEDISVMEKAVPLLPELTKVDMCDCGLSNEEMDALCQAFPNVRFVWKVTIGRLSLRTDLTGFIGAKYGYLPDARIRDPYRDKAQRLFNEDCENFKYFTDMVVMDLGHMGVTDYSFLEYMPKLQYLILADTQGTDFSVLSKLDNVIFLELFMTKFTQTELLLEMDSLECLNLGDTQLENPELLKQMTGLKMLWLPGTELSKEFYAEVAEALPDCKVSYYARTAFDFTGNGWRRSTYYRTMRDLLDMYYLD